MGILDTFLWDEVEKTGYIKRTQYVRPILDHNANLRREADEGNRGYSPSKEWRRAASIPTLLLERWRREEGLDFSKKDDWARIIKKLDDPDYFYLRTAPGRIAGKPTRTYPTTHAPGIMKPAAGIPADG